MPRTRTIPTAADYLDRLRELVKDDRWSQARVAERMGCHRNSLSRSLAGRDIPLSRVVDILAALDPPRTLADLIPPEE